MIPRKQDIAERFARSISTYETAGVVQREISEQLISLIEPIECGTVLEIGCGTGLLSSLLVERLRGCRFIYNDLSPEMERPLRQKVGTSGFFLPGDAERIDWPMECSVIASASCIQWWEDPLSFFSKSYDALMLGGQLVFSTFLPDNLGELSAVTGVGLHYPDSEEIESGLQRAGFRDIQLQQYRRSLYFPTLIELLRHLRNTGTNSLGSGGLLTPRRLGAMEQTYRENLNLSQCASLPLTYVGLLGFGHR